MADSIGKILAKQQELELAPKTITPTFAQKLLRKIPKEFDQKLQAAEWSKVTPEVQKKIQEAFQSDRWPLLLCGSAGSGKSCAAAVLYMRFQQKNIDNPVLWKELVPFLRLLTSAWATGEDVLVHTRENGEGIYRGAQWIIEQVRRAEFVVFDDLGTKTPTDSQYEALMNFMAARSGKPTVYTANLAPDQIREVYDDRVSSRLEGGTVIEMNGDDRRVTG